MKSSANRYILKSVSIFAIAAILLMTYATCAFASDTHTVNKRSSVFDAPSGKVLGSFAEGRGVTVIDMTKSWAFVESNGKRGYVRTANLSSDSAARSSNESSDSPAAASSSRSGVQSADWTSSNIRSLVNGKVVTIVDFATGLRFQARGLNGTLHSDVEPLTASDAATFSQIFGGKETWNRRGVIVITSSGSFAGSINGMPHGTQQKITDNNFSGVFCLHFTNSKGHGSGSVDTQHQAQINKVLAS